MSHELRNPLAPIGFALALLEQGAQGQGKILLIGSSLNQQEQDGIIDALGQQAAIHLHRLAGDETRLVGDEEGEEEEVRIGAPSKAAMTLSPAAAAAAADDDDDEGTPPPALTSTPRTARSTKSPTSALPQ